MVNGVFTKPENVTAFGYLAKYRRFSSDQSYVVSPKVNGFENIVSYCMAT